MARRGENIYHRKDGRWEGRCIVGRKPDGKPRFHSVYAKTYSEVKQKLLRMKWETMQEGEPVLTWGKGTLSDWMDHWLEVLEKPYIKATTYQLYKKKIEKHLRPLLGKHLLAQLQKEQIQAAADQLKGTLSPSTLHGVFRLLKSILSCGVKHHLLARSPYEEIRLPRFHQRRPRVLTVGEQARVERWAMEEGGEEYLLNLYTGLRLGELCALRYRDVDLEAGSLRVSHSVKRVYGEGAEGGGKLLIGSPKTESSVREIPLPEFLTQMLRERKTRMGAGEGEFLFPNTRGRAAEPRTMQVRLKRGMEKLGLVGVHFHTLRHTFAMRCLERGMSYKAVSELLGHSSSQITMKYYDHCTRESKIRLMQSVRLLGRREDKPSKLVMALG